MAKKVYEYPTEPSSPFWQTHLKLHGDFSPQPTGMISGASSPITPISPLSSPALTLRVALSSPTLNRERSGRLGSPKPFIIKVTALLPADALRPITILRAGTIFEEGGLESCLTFTARSNGVIKGPFEMRPLRFECPRSYPLRKENESSFLTFIPGEPYVMSLKVGPVENKNYASKDEKFSWGFADNFEKGESYEVGIVHGKRVGWWEFGDWEEVLGLEEVAKKAVVGSRERLDLDFVGESFQVAGDKVEKKHRFSQFMSTKPILGL